MVGYVTLGTNDLERATAFYDALLEVLGASQMSKMDRMVMYGDASGSGMLAICTPFDTQAANVGNGVMVALKAPSPEVVAQVHAKAIELGGSNEGDPGPRGDGGFHGCYFRDLDGNKLAAFSFGG